MSHLFKSPTAMRLILFTVSLALFLGLTEAKVYESLNALPNNREYDFVVIGSGPGGATVASRITEDRNVNVLLVEAGPDNEGVLGLQVPAYFQQIDLLYNWNYSTVPQPGLNNRAFSPYPRGHVLGGSSSINGMVYTRGAADDYNLWAKISGDNGWSWNGLAPYIKKHERWEPPQSGRNITGQYNPKVHGYNGNVKVSLPSDSTTAFDEHCLNATELEEEFSFNLDFNSGKPIGLGWLPSTIGNGERYSSAVAYLNGSVRARPNLSILLNTYALRVLPTGGRASCDFRTVELGIRYTSVYPVSSI